MTRENKIKEIHASKSFGVLVETGCGLPVTQSLMEVSGASNTVFFSESPYSKIAQDKKYGYSETVQRSVSAENVARFITHYEWDLKRANKNKDAERMNFIYSSSFQLGDRNVGSTHGWIGVWVEGIGTRFFHVSIHDSLSRKDYINRIGEIGIDILYHCLITEPNEILTVPSDCCIDIALDGEMTELTKEVLTSIRNEFDENFICFKNGFLCRMEDLFRDKETILLYKGSFNPVHIAHIHNADVAKAEYGTDPIFVISSSVYQKGWVDTNEIIERVRILTELGYSVIVTKNGFFNKNTEYIRKKFNQNIVYVVGSDTMNRLLESSYNIINPRESETYKQIIKHYEKEPIAEDDLKEIEDMSLSSHIKNFTNDFKNVSFFVINRPGSELKEEANRVQSYYSIVEEHPEYYHISSTKIREMKENNDVESMRKLLPEKVFEIYVKLMAK